MRSLKDFIRKRAGDFQASTLDDKTVFFLFRKIIREEYGMRGVNELIPTLYVDGVLSIKANNPLYSNELWIHREALVNRMNSELSEDGIHEIKLVRYEHQ